MKRDDIEIRVPLDYESLKQLEQQAQTEGVPRGTRARKLVRAGLALLRLIPNPALVAALAELPLKPEPGSYERVRKLLQSDLNGI